MDSYMDFVAVIVTPNPEERLIIDSAESLRRIWERGISGFSELLLSMLPGDFTASAATNEGGEIVICISDGPGFRVDDGGAWGRKVVREAFDAALQFLCVE